MWGWGGVGEETLGDILESCLSRNVTCAKYTQGLMGVPGRDTDLSHRDGASQGSLFAVVSSALN